MFHPINFGPGKDKNVLGGFQFTQNAVRALGPAKCRLVAFRNDHKKIQITIVSWCTPRMRSEEINRFGAEFVHQVLDGFVQKRVGNSFHLAITIRVDESSPKFRR